MLIVPAPNTSSIGSRRNVEFVLLKSRTKLLPLKTKSKESVCPLSGRSFRSLKLTIFSPVTRPGGPRSIVMVVACAGIQQIEHPSVAKSRSLFFNQTSVNDDQTNRTVKAAVEVPNRD